MKNNIKINPSTIWYLGSACLACLAILFALISFMSKGGPDELFTVSQVTMAKLSIVFLAATVLCFLFAMKRASAKKGWKDMYYNVGMIGAALFLLFSFVQFIFVSSKLHSLDSWNGYMQFENTVRALQIIDMLSLVVIVFVLFKMSRYDLWKERLFKFAPKYTLGGSILSTVLVVGMFAFLHGLYPYMTSNSVFESVVSLDLYFGAIFTSLDFIFLSLVFAKKVNHEEENTPKAL